MSELPLKWECVDISTFLYPVPTGVKPFIGKRKYYSTGSINGKAYLNEGEYTFQERPSRANRMAEEGDVLQARMQGTDKILLVDKSLSGQLFSTGFLQFRIIEKTYANKLLLFFMKSDYFLKQRDEFATGSTQIALTDRGLSNIKLLVPPFNEQRRIVAKLEKLLHKIDACKERLDKIPLILKRFRQSVLSAACSGRLTADWREKNPIAEPVLALIQQINKNRQENYKRQAKDAKLQREMSSVDVLPETSYPESTIPETWVWVRFGSIIGELRNGVPLHPNIDPPGTPILRISAVRPGRVDTSDIRYMPKGNDFLPLYLVKEFDLMFTRYNGTIELLGVCGMVRNIGKRILLYPDKLMRVRFDHALILPAYAEIFFQVSTVHERIVAKSKSSAGQNGVSGSDIKAQPFAFPPLSEQQELVRRVEALFKKADAIEARYKKAKVFVDKLTQSILAKAFRGELVAQDPNDEPASVLIERIRAEKKRALKKVVPIKGRVKKYKPFIPADLPMAAEEKAVYGIAQKKLRGKRSAR